MARPKGTQELVSTSIRLPEPIDVLWDNLARHMSLNKTSVLIVALRDLARKEGMTLPVEEETNDQ